MVELAQKIVALWVIIFLGIPMALAATAGALWLGFLAFGVLFVGPPT